MINRKILTSSVVIVMLILSAVAVWADEERNDEEIDRNFIEDPDMENKGTGDYIDRVTPYAFCDCDRLYSHTTSDNTYAIYAYSNGYDSEGILTYTYDDLSEAVYAYTAGYNSDGVYVHTTGSQSEGVRSYTVGDYSEGVYTDTIGDYSEGVYAYTQGYGSDGVYVYTTGSQSEGVRSYTAGDYSEGVYTDTIGDYSKGVYAYTQGYDSDGIITITNGDYSEGIRASSDGLYSDAIYGYAYGDKSEGLRIYSQNKNAINANTRRSDGDYAFFTWDNIFIGGKVDVVGTIDPIIVECFNVDPDVVYEIGDVVTLNKSTAETEPCTIADDTRIIGVVGPTLDIEDGEISVVIFGYRGARPDKEDPEIRMEQLKQLETMKSALQLEQSESKDSKMVEELEREIEVLTSDIEEAESVIRQVVRVKADASYAPIEIGDLLTTSPTRGHAMKAQPVQVSEIELYRPGTLIGKAMEPLKSGTGMIEVFVTLQ